jgi:dihydroorotate dehydrogenase (fumarate)
MADLTTKYMGLELSNPLLVASCSLSKNIDGVKRIAESGAGGVVLKSLFEEQIQKEMVEDVEQYRGPSWHTEAFDYVNKMGMELGPREYLALIEEAKKAVSLPVIASLNCVSGGWWKDYAKQIESAGADAIELNIAYIPADVHRESGEIEKTYFSVLEKVKATLNIPIAVKLGPFFTSMAHFAYELCRNGASALVLFNRFYQFDIDLEKMAVSGANPLSSAQEMYLPLKWIALLYGRVNCDLAATTGVHNSESIVKMIAAGAQTIQLCSILYKKDVAYVQVLLKEFEKWLEEHDIGSLEEIRGKLSQQKSEKPELYERLQYIKALVGIE